MSARLLAAIALGLGLAVVGSLAIAGSSYTPPASTGDVEGDGTGISDASAFRAALGLGTAATLTAGTAANNAVQLDGDGKLPAVDGSALTNVSAAAPSASAVPYAPASAGDWSNPDPTEVAGALDALAGRVVDVEAVTTDPEVSSLADLEWSSGTQVPAYLGSGTASLLTVGSGATNLVQLDGDGKLPAVDGSALTGVTAAAEDVSYTPTTGGDWTDPDPTTALGALDTLASRVVAAESQAAPQFIVCPSGCEYSTVQSAVTAAAGTSPTDGQSAVIQVYPGTYSESVTLAPHIAIVGMGGESHNFPIISGKVTADYGSASGPYQMAVSLSRMRISSPAGDYGIDFTGSGAQALHLQDVAVYMGTTGKGIRVNNSGSQGGFTSIVYADNIIVHGAGANANAGIELSAGRVNFTGPARLYSPVYAPALAISGTGLAWQTAGNIAMDGSMTYSSSAASSFISLSGTVASGAIISQSAGTLVLGQIGGYSATPSQAAVVSRSGTGVCLYSLGQINGYGYLAPTTGGCSALTGNGLYAAFQGLDSELTALASTTSAANALPYFTGAGTASTTTLSSTGRDLIDDSTAADMRTTLGLGTAATSASGDFQAADGELAALAGLTSAADALPYFTGAGTASTTTLTSAGRDLIDDASAADMRTTLGLGTAATLTSGTAAGNVVTLDGSAKLPAVDGSALTGIAASPYAADEWDAVWKAADGDTGWTLGAGSSLTTVGGKLALSIASGGSTTAVSYYQLAPAAPDQSFELRFQVYLTQTMSTGDMNTSVKFNAFGRRLNVGYYTPGLSLYNPTGSEGVGALGSGIPLSQWATITMRVTTVGVTTAPTMSTVQIQMWLGDALVQSATINSTPSASAPANTDGQFAVDLYTTAGTSAVSWVAYRVGHNDAPASYTYRGLGYAPDVAAPSVSP